MKLIEENTFGLYDFALGSCLLRKLKEHKEAFNLWAKNEGIDLDKEMSKIKRIRDFDRLLTAPTHGFKIPDDYYRCSSLGQRLKYIKVPTLLFSALDDPVITY